jgi:hypothetical protein
MNPYDYKFLENNPSLDPSSKEPYDPFSSLIINSFSDLKELDDSLISDSRFLPVIQEQFLEYVSNDQYSVLHNPVEDKYIVPLTPKRGNRSYAYKQYKKFKPIMDSFKERSFSKTVNNRGTMQLTSALLITFTFDHKQWLTSDAWKSSTKVINQFKAYLTKTLGLSYGSFLSKEGTKSGYPSPHLIVLLDNAVPAFKHNGKWRIQSQKLVNDLKGAWARYSRGSFCDIRAIVDGKIGKRNAMSYVLKYAMKTVSLDPDNPDPIAINTHAFQKLYNLRNQVSKDFLQRIDYAPTYTRLDIVSNELKLITKQRDKLIAEIEQQNLPFPFAIPISGHSKQLIGLNQTIERLQALYNLYRIQDSPWFFVSGGFTSIDQCLSYITNNDSRDFI